MRVLTYVNAAFTTGIYYVSFPISLASRGGVLYHSCMSTNRFVLQIATACAVIGSAVGVAAAHPESELTVGRTAENVLVRTEDAADAMHIEESVFPGINGYASGLIGFHSAELDDPTNGTFALSDSCDLEAILVSIDPGFQILNDEHIMQPGDAIHLGIPFFDVHPIFNIYAGAPGDVFYVTLRFHDLQGIYADSEPVTFAFTPEYCPADFNADGGVDGTDVEDFFASWESGGREADVNFDGGVDGADISVFFEAWEAGGCAD